MKGVSRMKVYEKICTYLTENKIKQNSVAEKAGIPIDTFRAILKGEKALYVEEFRAICLALNVSPEKFIEEKTA